MHAKFDDKPAEIVNIENTIAGQMDAEMEFEANGTYDRVIDYTPSLNDQDPSPKINEQVMSSNTETEIGNILSRLEDAVEQSTVARIHGRTMNNRMLHLQAMTEIYDLILQHESTLKAEYEEKIREARIDQAEHFSDYIGDWSKMDTMACVQLANARDIQVAELKGTLYPSITPTKDTK